MQDGMQEIAAEYLKITFHFRLEHSIWHSRKIDVIVLALPGPNNLFSPEILKPPPQIKGKMVSFPQLPAAKKDAISGAARTFFQPFLFSDSFMIYNFLTCNI